MDTIAKPTITKSSRVYGELKRDITAGKLRPGEHLVRRDLVKRFGVSLSIVNEALGRLSGDGLVENTEKVGTRVVNPDAATMRDELALREAVERHVVRTLAESASDNVLAGLLEDAQRLDHWLGEFGHEQNDQSSLMHLEFHLKLARATGYSSLEGALRRMGIRALLISRWRENQRLPHPPDFHAQLVAAIMLRDPNAADAKMRAHLHYADDFKANQAAANSAPISQPSA